LAVDRTELGILLAQTDRTPEAELEYRRAVPLIEKLAIEDPSVEAYKRDLANSKQNLANLLHRAGRLMEAEQEYHQAVAVLANLAEAASQNMLAWSLATFPDPHLRDPQVALRAAKKAVEQRPQVGEYWNALGVAHYRVGEWKAASEALEKSKQLRAGCSPSGWFFHAMTCWQQGQMEKARSSYDKGVDWMEKNNSRDEELRRFREEAA